MPPTNFVPAAGGKSGSGFEIPCSMSTLLESEDVLSDDDEDSLEDLLCEDDEDSLEDLEEEADDALFSERVLVSLVLDDSDEEADAVRLSEDLLGVRLSEDLLVP